MTAEPRPSTRISRVAGGTWTVTPRASAPGLNTPSVHPGSSMGGAEGEGPRRADPRDSAQGLRLLQAWATMVTGVTTTTLPHVADPPARPRPGPDGAQPAP